VNCFEMGIVQITARRFFIRPSVADFRLERGKFIGICQIEFVLENRCAGIAIIIGNGVIRVVR
jgi:hypothetical protein